MSEDNWGSAMVYKRVHYANGESCYEKVWIAGHWANYFNKEAMVEFKESEGIVSLMVTFVNSMGWKVYTKLAPITVEIEVE